METKLKALKVAELKDILNKASVPYDAKTTKSGLIKKVQESPAALAVASGGASAEAAEDDLLAPPEEVDWDEDLSKSKKVEAPKPAKSAPATATAPAVTSTPVVAAVKPAPSGVKDAAPVETAGFKADLKPLTVDEEIERRKARAAKWGTEVKDPVVAKPAPTASATSAKPAKPTKIVPAVPATDDGEKIKARQTRFGAAKELTKPITAPVVDEAEARKRKAREERFGADPGPDPKKPRTGP